MRHNFIIIAAFTALVACGDAESGNDLDSAERASNWSSEIQLTIEFTDDQEFEKLQVTEYSSSGSLNAMAEQLFDMAFSGEATVFLPSLFGEPETSTTVNPKELVDALQFFDSARVVDVLSGVERDTVIDMSFTKKDVSAVVLYLDITNSGDISLMPRMVGVGRQVFNEETGERRGINHKFFIACEGKDGTQNFGSDQLVLYTDSLGNIYPHAFQIHRDLAANSLMDWLKEHYPNEASFSVSFSIELNAMEGNLVMKSVVVESIKGKTEA